MSVTHIDIVLQICCKCVRCTSCGSATPGPDRDSVWTHDFSLCAPCGQLMDKGLCPYQSFTYVIIPMEKKVLI